MESCFQTPEQMIEPLQKDWNLYAPIPSSNTLDLQLAYWAESPRHKDDAFLCHVSRFHPCYTTGLPWEKPTAYHARVPGLFTESPRLSSEDKIISKLFGLPVVPFLLMLPSALFILWFGFPVGYPRGTHFFDFREDSEFF